MWFILLTGLLAQGLATQVSFQSSSSAASSSEQKTEWSWQEPTAAGNSPQDSFHPLSFSSGDTQPDLLSDNSQVGSSESAYSSESAVVENILQSSRQGRNIAGYDDLYSDPDVKTVLQAGNDTIARAFIKDKLCSLGLMNCDDSEGRRPFYSPHRDIHPQEVIYAQPVTIKPVGRPLPAIPVKKPFVYGPPKPVPIPSFGSGPPVYGPPSSGHYSGPRPPFSGPPPSFSGPYPSYKKPSINSGPRPIYEDTGLDGEYDFVPENNNEFIEKKQVIVQPSSGLQQHVHHHYHHTDGNKPSSVIGPSAIAGNGLTGNGYGHGSGTYGNSYNDFDEYKKAFKIKSPSSGNSLDPIAASGNSYANRYPVYEKPKRDSFFNGKEGGKVVNSGFTGSQFGASNFGSNNFGTNGFGAGNNGFNNNLGASNGLNNNFGTNNFGAGNNGFNNNLGGSNGFNNNFGSNSFNNGFGSNNYDDCVCVPYDQCAAIDQAGRKDDLFLAIDPRNIGKNIDAETEDIVVTDANGTMSVIRVPKEVNATEQVQHTKEQKNSSDKKVDDADKNKSGEEIKRSKREAKAQPKNDDTQGRLLGNIDKSKLNLRPTWGVSFGLPQGGNYPVNSYGGNPLSNPYPGYGGGGNGLDLGLLSVNPLVSVQVSKDEYGEKVVKPFVNLHVTPNHGLVNKLGNILTSKKEALFGGHGGYYPGGQYPGGHHSGGYAPQYYPSGPSYYHKPTFFEKPHYQERPQNHYHNHYHNHQNQEPSWSGNHQGYDHGYGYRPGHGYGGNYAENPGHYAGNYGGYQGYARDDEDYDFADYNANGYYRNAKSNISADEFGQSQNNNHARSEGKVAFRDRKKRDLDNRRQFGRPPVCGPRHVCCRKNQIRPGNNRPQYGQCGVRNGQGINGRIKTPVYVDGDSEFGEYPWQVAILKKDPSESVYVCGGTLISPRHILTAAHCVKTHLGHDLRARLGEWDVNHDVEFYPYIERDIVSINVHPEFYAGTLYNDIAILKLDHDVDFEKNPHISPACLPNPHDDFTGARCWTTGWGKDAFGDFGKYQNILKEVDVPIVSNAVCENQMRRTRLGPSFNLHSGFVCAGGEEGKDACKGDGGGPMVCERQGIWHLAGIVSWGIGCGQPGVPGVYTRVSHYLDWIRQNSY
ncbi:GSCOCT00005536001.2-RA-CDS [Cotesia congregata]|uniref:Phenoloxidase-activating factor 2 n=1 Tax=Cotesia congregata TaxID=51543 RepID=A0A8J2HCU0_COTCN|nr:GSCOCT00005536001.2-RA-CDS [Cotesia congregata]CAG5093517.1 Serine protease Stubble-like [Cotesia congregata]